VTRDARPTIAAAGLPVLLIPGNHDRFSDVFGTPGGTEFDRVFRSHWPASPAKVKRRVLQDLITGTNLGLVGADFCLLTGADASYPSLYYRCGQGKAYKQVISAMKAETQALRSAYEDIGITWVVHFPPCAIDGGDPALELLDREFVLDAARDESIRLILAGHLHVPLSVQHDETLVSCAGTAAAYRCVQGHWIHMLQIEVSNSFAWLADRRDFAWDGADFAPSQI
jgi:DNA repair exonuclease SbcCD nuclease subunit